MAEFESLSAQPGVFLRGRTERSWGQQLDVRYGLEALFVPTRGAKAGHWNRPGGPRPSRYPLEMKVALSPDGIGVLNGYRRAHWALAFAWAGGYRERCGAAVADDWGYGGVEECQFECGGDSGFAGRAFFGSDGGSLAECGELALGMRPKRR